MKKNFEIKCPLSFAEYKTVRRKIIQSNKFDSFKEFQKDIYFKVKTGRLKLRIISGKSADLIFYNRKEQNRKRVSNYVISKTADSRELEVILNKQFERSAIVIKNREIFTNENVRIHLDNVKGLGTFLEIEVIFTDFRKAKNEMKSLIEYLNLREENFIKTSYSDFLINKK